VIIAEIKEREESAGRSIAPDHRCALDLAELRGFTILMCNNPLIL
jgi:hypothetical protein